MADRAPTPSDHPGRWWIQLDDGRFQCNLCPRRCRLAPGQRGFCYVRAASEDGVVLKTYGWSSGYCIDPVEKKPLNHFLPGSSVLSFGTVGCNLGCRFCQNWDISKAREDWRLQAQAGPEDIARAAVAHGCASVAYTYNDPVIWAEYAIDTAAACRERGVRNIAVTAGYITAEARPEFYAAMDAANIDLKGFDEKFYGKVCLGHLQPVLDTLQYVVHETDCWVEITNLVIPGMNDAESDLDALSRWVYEHLGPDVPLHFTAFHPDYKMRDVPPTPHGTLLRARELALGNGLRYVYVGNVPDPVAGSTWCVGCGGLLIERTGYRMGRWGIAGGKCARCGEPVPGLFAGPPRPGLRVPYRVDISEYAKAGV